MAQQTLVQPLPFAAGEFPGCGGTLKSVCAHFCVTEIPEPSTPLTDGKHCHITLTREGCTTREMQNKLARLFSVRPDDIGAAGLKDRHARVTQTFSLPRENMPKEFRAAGEGEGSGLHAIVARLRGAEAEESWQLCVDPPPAWHRGKLRRGAIVGNAFEIIVSDTEVPVDEALRRARAISDALRQVGGWPNYYGIQRFGHGHSNAFRGRALFYDRLKLPLPALAEASGSGGAAEAAEPAEPPRKKVKRRAPWLEALTLGAFQSALFNLCVAERLQRGLFSTLLCGDLVGFPRGTTKPRLVKVPSAALPTEGGGAAAAAAAAEGSPAPAAWPTAVQAAVPTAEPAEPAPAPAATPSSAATQWGDAVDWSVAPSAEDAEAFAAGTITFTAPMFGADLATPRGVAAEIEDAVWAEHAPGVAISRLKPSLLMGTRRAARLPLPADLAIEACDEAAGLRFAFSLPSGAYATSLLREFMRNDAADAGGGGGGGGDEAEAE